MTSLPREVEEPALNSLRRAVEARPDLLDAARLLGFLSLFNDERTEEGTRVVRAALEHHPGHANLLFILGQLHMKKNDYQGARTIFEGLLKRNLEPSLIAAVRSQLDYVNTKLR